MEMKRVVARFMIQKVGSFVIKERVLCFGEYAFSTYDRENQQITNTWPYEDVEGANAIEGETDFIIYTPRHRIKKTTYRCNFRMEVLVCLMRLRSQHLAKSPNEPIRPELQTYTFQGLKYIKKGVQSDCLVEVRPDGIYQRDADGEVASHIPYTNLVSIDLICDNHDAIALNHSDNSSLFLIPKRTDLALAIQGAMKAYGMQMNEYRKKTMETAIKDHAGTVPGAHDNTGDALSCQFQVDKVSQTNHESTPRLLSITEKYITEYMDLQTVIISRPLVRIYSLILFPEPSEMFEVVYVDGVRRKYASKQREKIITELLASCHALGNHQVDVVTSGVADWIRMVPRKIIQVEGSKLVSRVNDANVMMDRELRVVQSCILQLLATHGYGKTARVQRQLPRGVDEHMHSLALELNVNTPTPGVIAQSNKPFEKVAFVIAREIHDLVGRHGPAHEFVCTYLQTLYRVIQIPTAMAEFMRILVERGEDYMQTVSSILTSNIPVTVYWMFMILNRLLESKTQGTQCRQTLLSNNLFMTTVMSMFDEDAQSQSSLSDLPTMKLCQFVFLLVKTDTDKQHKLSRMLYQQLATKYRMLQRILFGFPGLATVEACVGILCRMTKDPSFLHFGNMDSPVRSEDGKIPRHTLSFGETVNYGVLSQRASTMFSVRHSTALSRRNTYSSGRSSFSSTSSYNSMGGVASVSVQNPEVLLKQYRHFHESKCGSLKKSIDQYEESVFLRLRYRCRNIFLQELMNHIVGSFEEFKRVYSVDCHQFSGFLGTSNGQREKSDLYVTPRALIVVRVINRHTHEFEFRSIKEITEATTFTDAFMISLGHRIKYIYSDQSKMILQKMRELAGIIGIHLQSTFREQLPKQELKRLTEHDGSTNHEFFDVQKRIGRYGSNRFKMKKVCLMDGAIREIGNSSDRSYPLRHLRRVVIPTREREDADSMVALEFADGTRIVYAPSDMDSFLGMLYDGYCDAQNWRVSLSQVFPRLNPKLTPRALLNDDVERYFYLNHDGFYIPAHDKLASEIEKMSGEGMTEASATDKVLFAFESMNLNVDLDDFLGKCVQNRLSQLQFGLILRGMTILLEHSCKPPIRAIEVSIVLESFCRINYGCYKLGLHHKNGGLVGLVSSLSQVLVSGDSIATVWAINALHSLVVDKSRTPSHKSAEKHIRYQVFEQKKLIQLLVDILEQRKPYCSLAVLHVFIDVLVSSRESTENDHFEAIIKAFSARHNLLLEFASQKSNVGLAVAAISMLKVIVEHGDAKVRHKVCDAALESGKTMKDLYDAFFHPLELGRETYQYISGIWIVHHKPAYEMLLRTLPSGFMRMISHQATRKMIQKERDLQPNTEQKRLQIKLKGADRSDDSTEWFIRRMRQQISTLFAEDGAKSTKRKSDNIRMNYPGESSGDVALLAMLIGKDFLLPDLIWNSVTRNELKVALENAIETFEAQTASRSSGVLSQRMRAPLLWNHKQFRVEYDSISKELQVGHFYLRVILDRIKDGSLKLDQVAKAMDTSNGHLAKMKGFNSGDAGHLFHASIEIAKAPSNFFNEVYQCWLENLHLNCIAYYGSSSTSGSRSNSNAAQYLSRLLDNEQHCYWMLKILIELARVFPSARSVTRNHARFLTQLLQNSYLAGEIQDIVHLMSQMSASGDAIECFCTRSNVQMFLFMSALCHRYKARGDDGGENTTEDDEDIPVMELKPGSEDVSSFPITGLSFYDNSRFNLKWRAKHVLSSSADEVIVGGPFSALELKQYLDNDAFSERQSTAGVYLCCCSMHEKHYPDNHSWKSLFELPELRWMDLTDEPVDPYNTALHALEILRNFLANEQIKSANNANVWPLPLASRIISDHASLALLVQLLLVNDVTVRNYVCEMLMCLTSATLEKLYVYGTFYFLFAIEVVSKDTEKDATFVHESRLLQKIHRIQQSRERRYGQSYLLDLLPESLICILDTESPEHFADVYTGRKTDNRVLWTTAMRQHLQEMLNEHLQDFKDDLVRDVAIQYCYVPVPPVTYAELSRDVYCSGYYLSTLAESDAEIDAIEQPLILMGAIEEKWRYLVRRQTKGVDETLENAGAFKVFGWNEDMPYTILDLRERYRDLCNKNVEVTTVRSAFDALCGLLERREEINSGHTSDDVIKCILKAQARLLEKFSFQFFSYESKTLDLLLHTIAHRGNNDSPKPDASKGFDFRGLALRILQLLLSVAPQNINRLLEVDGCWQIVLDMLDSCAFGCELETKERVLSILYLILASASGVTSLVKETQAQALPKAPASIHIDLESEDDSDDRASFFTATEFFSQNGHNKTQIVERIYTLLDDVFLSFDNFQPWQIQMVSFDIIAALCRHPGFQNQIVSSTRIFWKGLYLIIASAAESSNLHGQPDVEQKQERQMIESAFLALRGLALGFDGQSRSQGLDVLANLLPLDFLDCLEKPNGHDFCTILLSDIREPSCIWNQHLRNELLQLIEEFCTDSGGDELSFLETAMNYMYDCLKSEPYVGGIYLHVLLEKASMDPQSITEEMLYPATAVGFMESLFMFLNENRDPQLGIYSDTLPALECLSVLADIQSFVPVFVTCLEQHVDDLDPVNASVSVATLGRYLLPFDGSKDANAVSISSRRSLSTYGFKSKNGKAIYSMGGKNVDDEVGADLGNPDYLCRQELALLILNKMCGFECSLERMLAPFCEFTWSLQVIADHLTYEQAFYALSCLAELCDTCLVVAEYVEVSGLWVEILGIALQSKQYVLHEDFLRAEALREPAFEVIYALLMKDFSLRERMYSGLCRFLPYPIVYQIHLDPSKATKFFDDNHEKSDLIWNSHWRTEVRKKLDQIICRNRIERSLAKRDSVLLDDDDYVRYPNNFIAGLYLDRFLSRPDPEKLTNPAYNLELLFQLWREQLHCLMSFDLENPPDNLKSTADEVEKYTTAITHILRAPLCIDESIANNQLPGQIVKLIRHCNKHLVTSFPYRCILRVARRLVQFPEIMSADFLELLFCRITLQHSDIPALVKLVRRILEARQSALAGASKREEPEFYLRDLKYFSPMVTFLESLVNSKEHIDPVVLSNVNRILRIINAEAPKDDPLRSLSRSFMGRWHNQTLTESRLSQNMSARPVGNGPPTTNRGRVTGNESFNVDDERDPSVHNGTFNVDEEREPYSHTGTFDVDAERGSTVPYQTFTVDEVDEEDEEAHSLHAVQAPPKSINFDGQSLEVQDAVAPRSFRFNGNEPDISPLPSPKVLRQSTLRANYEPIDSQYHSKKAAEYDEEEKEDAPQRTRRGSVPDIRAEAKPRTTNGGANGAVRMRKGEIPMSQIHVPNSQATDDRYSDVMSQASGMGSERRYSLLDSWRSPSTGQSNSSLTSLTISRRGRRAAAVYSRRKSKAPKRWFG